MQDLAKQFLEKPRQARLAYEDGVPNQVPLILSERLWFIAEDFAAASGLERERLKLLLAHVSQKQAIEFGKAVRAGLKALDATPEPKAGARGRPLTPERFLREFLAASGNRAALMGLVRFCEATPKAGMYIRRQ